MKEEQIEFDFKRYRIYFDDYTIEVSTKEQLLETLRINKKPFYRIEEYRNVTNDYK